MQLKPSTKKNLPKIMEIISDAQLFLAKQNIDQWQDGYPNEEQILLDIQNKDSYIILNDSDEIMATTVFTTKTEPTYLDIDGEWLTPINNTYGVIHRLAVGADCRNLGIAKFVITTCEEKLKQLNIDSMRTDTHRENKSMQSLITKLGYSYCGIIKVRGGAERLAFEKVL